MNNIQEALPLLRAEFERWDALLASLSEAQLTSPQLDDDWSIKDAVAHLHAWQQRSVARVQAALDGGEPDYPTLPAELDPETEDVDALNAWFHSQTRPQPWPEVYGNWRATFAHLLQLSAQVPDKQWLGDDRYPWMEGYPLLGVLAGTYEHHQEHWEFLQPVLARIRT